MLVLVVFYVGNGGQILADELAQNTRSSTVQNAYSRHSHKDGIVDEIGDGIDGFVASHAADVDVLLEVQFAVIDDVAGIVRNVGIGACDGGVTLFGLAFLLRFGGFGMLQPLSPHLGLHIAKDDGGHLAVYAFNGSDAGESLDAHGVADGNGGLLRMILIIPSTLTILSTLSTLISLLLTPFLLSLLPLLYLPDLAGYSLVVAGIHLGNLVLEGVQLFAYPSRSLLLSLTFTYLAYRVFYLLITLAQQFLSLFLGSAQYLLALVLYFLNRALVAGYAALERLFVLVNGLTLTLPVALVAHDVLQVLVALYVFRAHDSWSSAKCFRFW